MAFNSHEISRRVFLKRSLLAAGGVSLYPMFGPNAFAQSGADDPFGGVEPHAFLCVILPQGADWSYLLDARPLEMTANGVKQNYLNEEPKAWGGGRTLATSLADPLRPFEDDLAILNGVTMSLTFDGHDQNTNLFFTGSAFGGDSFVPKINASAGAAKSDMDSFQLGSLFAQFNNLANSLTLTPETWKALRKNIELSPSLDLGTPLMSLVKERLTANGAGSGLFSLGARHMLNGLMSSNSFYRKMNLVTLDPNAKSPMALAFDLMKEAIRHNICRSFLLVIGKDLDVHSAGAAKVQAPLYKAIAEELGELIGLFKKTPFNEKSSYWEITTFCATSEFSRTLRQEKLPVDQTGTDHNPLSNTFILGGKGIRGGVVGGESDFRASDEKLSSLHKKLDPTSVKSIGKPCDLKTLDPLKDWPEEFDEQKFLNVGHVVNTIMARFGLPKESLRKMKNGEPFQVLDRVLK